MTVLDDMLRILGNSLPEAIGGLVAAAVLGALGVAVARYRKRKTQPCARQLVQELVDDRFARRFEFEGALARTDDDESGLALISAIIDRKAVRRIDVIGRGSQWVDRRTRDYVSAVARAILRGVGYTRILILDKDLPENGLVWLLLLERFSSLPAQRGRVALHPVYMQQSQSLVLQFQLVDEMYLHRTNRHYLTNEPGASRCAHSLFAIAPHAEVEEHKSVFRQHLAKQGPPLAHREIVGLIEKLLTTTVPHEYAIRYHWQLAVEVIKFLDTLDVPGLPERGLELVGALMPFTFTFEAAQVFCAERRSRNRTRPVVIVPFECLDDAVRLFEEGSIDHICIPVENTRLDQITPPTMNAATMERIKAQYFLSSTIELDVSFVLAGTVSMNVQPTQLAAVDSSYEQIVDCMKKRTRNLPRTPQSPQSNYHAAWMASQDSTLAAVTTQSAAEFLGLQVYEKLRPEEKNVTTFNVLSHGR